MMEDSRTITRAIDMVFIARALERIGDHAKNMADRVIYRVKVADVRHTGVKNAERQARGDEDTPESEQQSADDAGPRAGERTSTRQNLRNQDASRMHTPA